MGVEVGVNIGESDHVSFRFDCPSADVGSAPSLTPQMGPSECLSRTSPPTSTLGSTVRWNIKISLKKLEGEGSGQMSGNKVLAVMGQPSCLTRSLASV